MSDRYIGRKPLINTKAKSPAYNFLQERVKEGSIAHARTVLGKVPNRKPLYKEDEL